MRAVTFYEKPRTEVNMVTGENGEREAREHVVYQEGVSTKYQVRAFPPKVMATENKKKVFVNVPMTFEAPQGMSLAKRKAEGDAASSQEDLTSKFFKLY